MRRKIHIKEVRVIEKRNVFGEPLVETQKYYLYVWGLFGRKFLNIDVTDVHCCEVSPMLKTARYFYCTYKWSVENVKSWTRAEAYFLQRDIENNPNKYEMTIKIK